MVPSRLFFFLSMMDHQEYGRNERIMPYALQLTWKTTYSRTVARNASHDPSASGQLVRFCQSASA